MQHIKMHITGPSAHKKERITERGEMLKFFLEKINRTRKEDGWPPMTMGRMGKTLEGIPTKDLYYLKSVCDQASNFSKKFWWEINPKNHTEEKVKEREKEREFNQKFPSGKKFTRRKTKVTETDYGA